MKNLSYKISCNLGYNVCFAGKTNVIPISQKTQTGTEKADSHVLSADIFQKQETNLTENQKQILKKLSTMGMFALNEHEDEFKEIFPTLCSENQNSPQTYLKTSKFERECANVIADKPVMYMESVHAAEKISDAIKENLDIEYGKNNYSVFGIGRSATVLTRILNYNGANSNSIPFSMGVIKRNESGSEPETIVKILDWKNYFSKFGLDEKTLTDKKKTTIVTDFVFSGKTLNYFKDILNKLYPNNNAKFISIMDLLADVPSSIREKHNITSKDTRLFAFSLDECDYKLIFSTTDHLHTFDEYKNYNPDNYRWPLLSKIFLLSYMDKKNKSKLVS